MLLLRRKIVCAVLGTALCLTIGIASGLGQGTSPAKSVAPEKLIPAESVLYFTSDGLDTHDASWKKTAAYESLYASGVMTFVEKLINFALDQAQADSAGLAKAAMDTLTRKGFSVAVSFPPGTEGPSIPYGVVVLHQGANLKPAAGQFIRESLEGQVQFVEKTVSGRTITSAVIPGSGGMEVGWWVEGTHLVIVGGANPIGATLGVVSGKTPDVTTNAHYKKLREGGKEVNTLSWLDAGSLNSRFGDFPIPLPAGEMPVTIKSISEALGLKALGTITSRSGFDGPACWTESNVETSGPRTGLLALADQKTLTLADLPPLPVDSTGYSVSSFDLGKTYTDLIEVARRVAKIGPPEALEELERNLNQLPDALGLDVRKEFLEPLGNVVCVYDDPLHGSFGIGITAAVQVDDAATLRKTINALLGRLEDQSNGGVSVVRTKKHGREILSLQFRAGNQLMPFGVSLVIDDKWLVLGLMPQSLEAFLLRMDGKLPTAQKAAGFAEMMKGVPAKFSGLTVSDPRKTYGAALSWAPFLMSMAQMGINGPSNGPRMELPFTAADLPPAELVVRPLFPNVSVTTVDATGIRMVSRTSLPSLPFLSIGGDGAATTAIAVALLLPAVQQAREAARRSQSKNNLKQLGLSMHNYHDVNNGFPQGAKENKDLKLEKQLSWLSQVLPYLDQAALYNQIKQEEAWDSNDNKTVMRNTVPVLLNPGVSVPPGEFGVTHYTGMAGVGKDSLTAKEHDNKTGVFGYNRKTRLADITDGTSNTIMITEASKDFSPWGQAKGSIRALTKSPHINGPDGIGGPFRGGCHILLSDGSVRFVSESINQQTFEALITAQGAEVIGDF